MEDGVRPIRILQMNSGSKNFGGVSSFLYNIYLNVDKTKIQFDFLSPEITTYGVRRSEIEALGGRIFELKIKGRNMLSRKLKLLKCLTSFLRQNEYKVVHINSGNFFFNLFASKAATLAGVPCIIIHSHNTGDPNGSVLKKKAIRILKPLLEKRAVIMCACTQAAAEYMFLEQTVKSGRVRIIHNGIDAPRFHYDGESRKAIRSAMGIDDKFVVGHVGRFHPQKNHPFLVKIFNEIYKQDSSAVLLLIGDGDEKQKIIELVQSYGLTNVVFFLETKIDIERYYQAMDVLMLPSFYEGLGMVNIEAQCSGLSCIVSNGIPDDVNITGRVSKLPLDAPIEQWVNAVLDVKNTTRQDCTSIVRQCGYDVAEVAIEMQSIYLDCTKGL